MSQDARPLAVMTSVEIAGQTVLVRELTVAEIRQWLANLKADVAKEDSLSLILFDDVTFGDLRLMTDLTDEQLASATPSELRQVADKIKAVNSHFFAFRGRLSAMGEKAKKKTDAAA